jgi:hypothetical protein
MGRSNPFGNFGIPRPDSQKPKKPKPKPKPNPPGWHPPMAPGYTPPAPSKSGSSGKPGRNKPKGPTGPQEPKGPIGPLRPKPTPPAVVQKISDEIDEATGVDRIKERRQKRQAREKQEQRERERSQRSVTRGPGGSETGAGGASGVVPKEGMRTPQGVSNPPPYTGEYAKRRDRQTKSRVRRTAARLAKAQLRANPRQFRNNKGTILRALRTQAGRELFVGERLGQDWDILSQGDAPNQTTGLLNPFQRALNVSKRNERRLARLERQQELANKLARRYERRAERGDYNGALDTARRVQGIVQESKKVARNIQRGEQKRQRITRQVVREIAKGGDIQGIDIAKDQTIKMPTTRAAEIEARNTVEDMVGLNLSPADVGMAFVGGGLGRIGIKAAVKAGKAGKEAAKIERARRLKEGADDMTALEYTVYAAQQNALGRNTKRFIDFYRRPGVRQARNVGRAALGTGVVVGQEYTFPFIESQVRALGQPGELFKTTARNAIGTVVAPFVIGGNLGLTIKRAAEAPFADTEYQKDADYITGPIKQLAEESWKEITEMADIYTSKDVDRMTEATVEDYGIGPIFSAYYMTRPLTKGITRGIGKTIGDGIVVPAKGTARGWDRWNANAMGIRNPFTNADPVNMRGLETISDIRARRRKASRGFGFKAREDAREAAVMASVTKPIIEGRQAFNASPGGKSVMKGLDDWNKSVFPDREIEVMELAGIIAQRGIDADAENAEFRFDAQTLKTWLNGTVDGSPDALRLQAIISNPKLLTPNSPEQRAFLELVAHVRVSDALHKQVRAQSYADGPEGRAKAQMDQNARDLQTLITYSQLTGNDVAERPEVALETIRAKQAELLAAKEATTDAERGKLARIEKELADAKEALRNREIQDRVRIRQSNAVVKKLAERQRKTEQRLKKAQNALWHINTEGLQETLTTRLRVVNGRIGELEKRGPERGLTREEAAELKGLEQEREQIKGDQEQIKNLDKEVADETRAYEKATKRLRDEEAKQKPKIDDRLMTKIAYLEQEVGEQKKVVAETIKDTETYRAEVVDTLTQREYEAIERRIDEELLEEYPPLGMAGMGAADVGRLTQLKRRLLGRKKERLAKRNYEIELVLDSHRSLTDELYDDLLVDLDQRRAELAAAREELATRLQDIEAFAERLAQEVTDAFDAARTGISYYEPSIAALRDDAIRQVERLEAEVQRLELHANNHNADMPESIRNDLENERAQNQLEISVIENRLNQMTPEDIVSLRGDRIRAAVGKTIEQKKRSRDAVTLAALQRIFDRDVRRARDAGLIEATFISQRSDPLVGRAERGGPAGAPLLGVAREQQRTGALERSGDIDRSEKALIDTFRKEAKKQANQNVSEWILANAVYSTDVEGRPQIEFTRDGETKLRQDDPNYDPDKYYALDTRLLSSKHIGSVIDALQKGKEQKYIDELDTRIEGAPVYNQVVAPSGEQRLAQKFGAEGEGQRFVLVEKDVLDIIAESEAKLKGWDKALYGLNRLSSRIVLGTSPSWALAQPIAEMLILVADQPNLVRLTKAWRQVGQMRKDPELARGLARLAGNNMGVSRQLRGADQNQADYKAAMKALRMTPAGQFMREAAKLEVLGKFDKWKAGWIREVGVVAELDRELSVLRRSGKALSDQMDAIEEYADLLSTMTRAEQIRWLNSKEGMAAGERLTRNIDAALGNWTDIKPGAETFIGSTIFFYPFVRFSLRWTFETFPKRHPVRASMAMLYGAINAEMLERLINYDPIWLSDWAVAPIFTGEGDPISLVPLNRVSISGNALVEYGARDGNPFFNLTKILPPLASAMARTGFSVDEFGQPLKDPNAGFMPDREVGPVTSLAGGIESLFNLAAPIRETARITGIDIGDDLIRGALDKGNWAGLIPKQKNTPIDLWWNDDDKDEDRRYSRPKPGQDENLLRDLLRRNLFATIPVPTKYYVEEQHVNRLFRARELAQKTADQGYPKVMYKGRYQSLADAARSIMAERTAKMNEKDASGFGSYKRSKEDQALVDKFLKISGIKVQGNNEKDQVEGYLYDYYQSIGVRMGVQNPIRSAVLSKRRQGADSIKEDWKAAFGDTEFKKRFPGLKQAEQELAQYEREQKANETGFGGIAKTGPVAPQGGNPQMVAGKSTPSRRKLVQNLRAQTRNRLSGPISEGGKRRVDLSDPTIDPATKIKQTDKGKIVTRYRGKKVLGDMTISAMRRAEQNGTLDIDEDGRLTIPESRQAIAQVERQGERVAKQQQKVDRLLIKAGGVPANVPKKYRGLIRKWGAYLDREMEKNGLVGVEGGKPVGMSGAEYLAKIIQAESGWDERIGHPDNTSSAQAQGLGQFIPSTREAFLKFGVDAYGGAAEQIKAAAFHLDGNYTAGGLTSYNPGFPEDSDGTWGYYLNQDVGEMIVPNNRAAQKLQQARERLQQFREDSKEARQYAKAMGIEVEREVAPDGTISWPAKPARKINGAWAGSERILDIGNGGDFEISSEKRTPDENASVGGSSTSDHLTTNQTSYAHDLPTTDVEYGNQIIQKYYNRLKLNEPIQFSGTHNYTSRRFPGYSFQIIWQDDGHYDHVHIGVRYTGEDLPPGTYSGAGPGGTAAVSGGGSGGGSAAGGGMAGGGGQAGGGQPFGAFTDEYGNRLSLAESQDGNEEPLYAVEQVLGEPQTDPEKVESVSEVVDALPSVKKRKQDLLRFDPSRRI